MKKNYYTEEKRHYKLYKAKSRWLVAAITTSGLVLLATAPASQAQADSVDEVTVTQTTNNQVTTNSQNADTEQTTNQVQTNTQTATANQTENVAASADVTPATTEKDHVKGNVQAAWDQGYQGQGMVVSVIDSGADTNHKDFAQAPKDPAISKEEAQAQINKLGYGTYASEKFPFVYNYASRSNDWIKDDGPDASQHGQHVSGIIGANGQANGTDKYAVGVAPEAQLMMMRVFNDQFADENTDDIAQAIYDAVKLGANVIQMSLGQGVAANNLNDVEQKAVQYATEHGVFVSISASNSGNGASVAGDGLPYRPGGPAGNFSPFSSSTVANPGASVNALTVAAENSDLGDASDMASFSSWGALPDFTLKPDLSAPGVSVVSTGNDNGYNTMSGTSMAGPFNAGAAALVMQRLKATTDLTGFALVQATKALLMNTARPMTQVKYTTPVSPRRQGAGQIDVGAATASPVYITAADGTSSLSLKQVGESTNFTLTFTNLSNQDQTYTFDDFGGGLTEKRDEKSGIFYDEYLAGAHVNGPQTVTVKAGQSANFTYSLNLTGLKKNQLVEGWLRFTNQKGQAQLVVPYLAYFGDMTTEDVFDKAANQDGTIFGGNYFVNENNFPRGVADQESLKALVNLDGKYNWQQVAKLYQDGKVAFSPNNNGASDILKPYAFIKQNLKDLKIQILDANGKVVRTVADEQGLDKSFYNSGNNQDITLSVSMRNDRDTLDWDGKLYNDQTGQMETAPDGQYTYRYIATLYNEGDKQVQTADYPVVIDTTAPVISNLAYDETTHTLSFDYQDQGAGFTDYSYAIVKVNNQAFGYKLKDGDSHFTNDGKTAGHFQVVLNAATLAAFTTAKNALSVAVTDVADNGTSQTLVLVAPDVNTNSVNIWNATNGLAFDQTSPDYNATNKTYTLRGSANQDFYYNGALVQVATDGTFALPVATNVDQVVLTADPAGQKVLTTLKTSTPKAAFAWQVANTEPHSFGPMLNTVIGNNPDDVVVQAAVTVGDNVKAYAQDYFSGELYEAEVKDGLATFHIHDARRTVLVGWTEVTGPNFNDVQTTPSAGVYLGVMASASYPAPGPAFTKASQLGTDLVQEKADSATLGNPDALPGHAVTDLTTKAPANTEINFDYLTDNDYNWVGAKAITDGVYDPENQVFTVTGKVTPEVTALTILGDSSNESDPANQVALQADGSFTFSFHVAPTAQRPIAYIYTTSAGQTRGTMELILDTALPSLDLADAQSYQLDADGNYQIYTNNPNFTLAGTANDNVDGYRFFVNGNNEYREFHNSGVNFVAEAHTDGTTVTNPYPAHKFNHSFDLRADGQNETTHVYTLKVTDVVGNTVEKKFYVHYQAQATTDTKVVTQKQAATTLLDYATEASQLKDAKGDLQAVTGADLTPGQYRLFNKYGNLVLNLTVTPDPEVHTTSENNVDVQKQELTNTDAKAEVDNKSEVQTEGKVTSAPQTQIVATKVVAAKHQASLPQTGEKQASTTSLGVLALALATLCGLFGFGKSKKED